MKTLLAATAVAALTVAVVAADKGEKAVKSPLDFKMTGIDGKEVDLSKYKGKVVMFVNVASYCGYTPQYKGLEELYEKYEKAGLVVIGVPSNDFGAQEPGSNEEIQKFCKTNYKVTFPLLSKVAVKGENKAPLYKFLTEKDTDPKFGGDEVSWNFEKFLVGRNGEIAGRFKSKIAPDSDELVKAITTELEKK
jgi:glutathione peroxidase